MDKNKIIEAAAKLVAKGAYDKAIKEYQKVLEVDPKDVRILQKMGELYQKKNDNAQAAQYFTRVAESYTADGFFLKAVALYKQVLKLDPSLMEINIKLAELHQQLQLMGEAMAYFQVVANYWDKQGDTRRTLEVLRKLVDLNPDNVASRVKLADLYVREGFNAEATAEFSKAAEHLKRNNRTDDYLRVAERLSGLQPDNLQLAKELAEAYLQRNDQKRALAKLQICFKADNRDIETLRLLAVAFQALGQTPKTISVYKELARAYEDKNLRADAEQVWGQVERLDPADPDVQSRRSASARPVPSVAVPSNVAAASATGTPAYPPSGDAPSPQRSVSGTFAVGGPARAKGGDNLGKLLTDTDVYVKYGLHDKALEHLRKVFAIDPENIDAHEKAYAIYVASSNHAQAFEQLLNVLRLHTRAGASTRAQPYLATILQQNPAHPEVAVFVEALGSTGKPVVPPEPPAELAEDAILVDSSDDEVVVAEEHQEVSSETAQLAGDDAIEADVIQGDDVSEVESIDMEMDTQGVSGLSEDASEPQLVADFDDQVAAPPYEAPGTEASYDAASYQGADYEGHYEGEPTTGEFAQAEGEGETGALPAYGLGEDEQEAPTRETQVLDPSVISGQSGLGDQAGEEPAAEECDEAVFFAEQGLYDEAREILETVLIAYPEHRRAAELMAHVEAAQGGAMGTQEESRDAFDLAAELASELGDFGDEQVDTDESPASSASDQYQVSVEEVFAEFKKGVEKVVKPEDVETHYDLGVAYKEMGLVDDAVGEFSIARRGCMGKRKEIDCLSMIGMLQLSHGQFAAAIDAYQQCLANEHAQGEVEKSLRYELGTAYEASGQVGKALGQYLKVQGLDPAYRDVAFAVERLSAVSHPEDEAPRPGTSGRKVGYI